MPKSKELTIEERYRIQALFYDGWSYRKIAEDVKCSLGTVKYTLDRVKSTGQFQNSARAGRPPKLSQSDRKYLIAQSLQDRRKCARELAEEVNSNLPDHKKISSQTAARILVKYGLSRRVAGKRSKWLQFATKYGKWTIAQWKKVHWTEESKFKMFGSNQSSG